MLYSLKNAENLLLLNQACTKYSCQVLLHEKIEFRNHSFILLTVLAMSFNVMNALLTNLLLSFWLQIPGPQKESLDLWEV